MASALLQMLTIRITLASPRAQRAIARVLHHPSPPLRFRTSTPSPRRSASSSSVRSATADIPPASASPPPPPARDWRASWRLLLERLHSSGHFSSDPHIAIEDIQSDPAAMKRAVLSYCRQRADILSKLDTEKIARLAKAGLPKAEIGDRKSKNAYRRLHASFVLQQPLSPGDGGAADFQDVLRMVLALAGAERSQNHQELADVVKEILPEILVAMDSVPPQGESVLSEKAVNMQRLKDNKEGSSSCGGRGRGRGGPPAQKQGAPWSRNRFD